MSAGWVAAGRGPTPRIVRCEQAHDFLDDSFGLLGVSHTAQALDLLPSGIRLHAALTGAGSLTGLASQLLNRDRLELIKKRAVR